MNTNLDIKVRTLESRRNSKRDAKKCKIIDYTNKKCENFDEMNKEDFECCICMGFIAEPTITPCKHIFCFSCLEDAQDFKDECPMCRQNLKYYGPEVDQKLQEYLQENYTEEFEEREQELKDQALWTGHLFCSNFILENEWEEVRNPTVNRIGQSLKHRYTICFRDINDSDRVNKIVEKVEIKYPEDYKNNIRVLKEENEWKLTGFSWEDSIEVNVKVYFKAFVGYDPFDCEFDIICNKEGNYINFKISIDKDSWNEQEKVKACNHKNSLKSQAIKSLK